MLKHILDRCQVWLGYKNTSGPSVITVKKPELNWEWEGNSFLKIDDVSFIVDYGVRMKVETSRGSTFVLAKARRQLEIIQELQFKKPIQYVFDLGIYKGGSVMFYYKFFNPKKLVAIELKTNPIAALDDYIREHQLDDVIRPYYGVDQSDEDTLHEIVRNEMRGQPLDLIVDDASHLLLETRASFNILFPYLSPGGYYIIEDWGWAHWLPEKWQKNGGLWPEKPPLTNLIFELTMLCASRPDLVESIFVIPAYVVIRKGYGACEPGIFNISTSYANRGKPANLLS